MVPAVPAPRIRSLFMTQYYAVSYVVWTAGLHRRGHPPSAGRTSVTA